MNYQIHIVSLPRDTDLEKIVETFERINRTGEPLSIFELLTARLKKDGGGGEGAYKIEVQANRKEFEGEMSNFDEYLGEMPTYNDFVECLLSSNVLKYGNESDFIEKLKHFRAMKKRAYFCPDTNILYHRFISNYSGFKQNEIVFVDTVKEEIEACLNFKYDPYQISELKNLIKYQNYLLDEWVNRRMKKSRKAAYIALEEYKKVKELALIIEGVEASSSDKEENDKIIVKSVKRFEKEKDALPVLLTADISMTDVCEIEDLEYFLFEVPREASVGFCTADQILQLIYNLAAVFGVVKLNSVRVFSEFGGKTQHKLLKLKFLDEKIMNEIEKDLRICRRLMNLGIEK